MSGAGLMGVTNMPENENDRKKTKVIRKTRIVKRTNKVPDAPTQPEITDEVREEIQQRHPLRDAEERLDLQLEAISLRFGPFLELLKKTDLSADASIDEFFQRMKEPYREVLLKIKRLNNAFTSKEERLDFILELEKDLRLLTETFESSEYIRVLIEVNNYFGNPGFVKLKSLSLWESMLDEYLKKALQECQAVTVIKETQFDVLRLGFIEKDDLDSLHRILAQIKERTTQFKDNVRLSPLFAQYQQNKTTDPNGFEPKRREILALFNPELQTSLEQFAFVASPSEEQQLMVKEYRDLMELKTVFEEFQFTQPEKKEIEAFQFDMLAVIFKDKLARLSQMTLQNRATIEEIDAIGKNFKKNKQAILKLLEQLNQLTPTQVTLLKRMDPQDKNFSNIISKTTAVIRYLRTYPELFSPSATLLADRLQKRFLNPSAKAEREVFSEEIQELSRLEIHPLQVMQNTPLTDLREINQVIEKSMSSAVDDAAFSALLKQLDDEQEIRRDQVKGMKRKLFESKRVVEQILQETNISLPQSENTGEYRTFKVLMDNLQFFYRDYEKRLKELEDASIVYPEVLDQLLMDYEGIENSLRQMKKGKTSLIEKQRLELQQHNALQEKLKMELLEAKQRWESYQPMLHSIAEKISELGDADILNNLQILLKKDEKANLEIKRNIDDLMQADYLSSHALEEVKEKLENLHLVIRHQEAQLPQLKLKIDTKKEHVRETRAVLEQSYSEIKHKLKDFFSLLDSFNGDYHTVLISNAVLQPHFSRLCNEINKIIALLENPEIYLNRTEAEQIIRALKSRYLLRENLTESAAKNSEEPAEDETADSKGLIDKGLSALRAGLQTFTRGAKRVKQDVQVKIESRDLPSDFLFVGQEEKLFQDVSKMDISIIEMQLEPIDFAKKNLPVIESPSTIELVKLSIKYDSYFEQVKNTIVICDQQFGFIEKKYSFLEDEDKQSLRQSILAVRGALELPLNGLTQQYQSISSLNPDDSLCVKQFEGLTQSINLSVKKLVGYTKNVESSIQIIETKKHKYDEELRSLQSRLANIESLTVNLQSMNKNFEEKYTASESLTAMNTSALKSRLADLKANPEPQSTWLPDVISKFDSILNSQEEWLNSMIRIANDVRSKILKPMDSSVCNPYKKEVQEVYERVAKPLDENKSSRLRFGESPTMKDKLERIKVRNINIERSLSVLSTHVDSFEAAKNQLKELSARSRTFDEHFVKPVLDGYEYLLREISDRYQVCLSKNTTHHADHSAAKKSEPRPSESGAVKRKVDTELSLERSEPQKFMTIHPDLPVLVELYQELQKDQRSYISEARELIDRKIPIANDVKNELINRYSKSCIQKFLDVGPKLQQEESQIWWKKILRRLKAIFKVVKSFVATFFSPKPLRPEYVPNEAVKVLEELDERLSRPMKGRNG